MRWIRYSLEVGFAGCHYQGSMEIDDDMTNEQIDAMVHEMALDNAQSWEGDERLGWDPDQTEEEREQETEFFYENVYGTWEFEEEDV